MWHQCSRLPLCLSHMPKVTALLLSGSQSTIVHLMQCLFATFFINSPSLALWIAFLAALITDFFFCSLHCHYLSPSFSLPFHSLMLFAQLVCCWLVSIISDPDAYRELLLGYPCNHFLCLLKKMGAMTAFLCCSYRVAILNNIPCIFW